MNSNALSESRPIVLEAVDLWKIYREKAVVQGVSFTLERGVILGMLGPNGAGKTTTVGMLYGGIIPSRGFARFGNLEIPRDGREARAKMGVVPQDDNLDRDFSVEENLWHFAFHYRIAGLAARARADQVLELVGLTEYKKYAVDELSGGLKRRLILARALLSDPILLFLDEPTTGLDPEARQDFWKIVGDLKRSGVSIVLTTHYMEEAQRLCDRLLLLQDGKVIDQASPEELVTRIAGDEVIEVEGIDQATVSGIATRAGAWHRGFGSGFLVGLPLEGSAELWDEFAKLAPSARTEVRREFKLVRRNTNLDDVFLILTGASLK